MAVRKIKWLLQLHLLLHTSVVSQEYITVNSERSGPIDDDKTTAKCPTGYFLTNCIIVSGSSIDDGVRVPGDLSHSCIAQNGWGDGVIVSHVIYSALSSHFQRLVFYSTRRHCLE